MIDTSRCEVIVDAILADASRRADVDAHLETCPACRELAAAHRGAQALPRSQLVPPPLVQEGEVLGRVRRRRAARLAGAGVAVASLAAVLLLAAPPRAPEAAVAPDLFALADGVAELTSRDPLGADPALRRFDAVSDWLAPPRARSLGLDSIAPPSRAGTAGGDVP